MVTSAETVAAPATTASAVAASATPAAPVVSAGAVAQAVVAKPGEAVVAAAPAAGLLADTQAKTEGAPVDKAPEAKAEAPKTDWKLTAPEGVALAAEDIGAIEAFAKENGLSQAQAEKVLARDVASKAAADAARETQATTIGETWRQETEAHPEIGGAKLPAAIEAAKRALAVGWTPEERKAIADSPFANNPMFIAGLSRLAAHLKSEDGVPSGGSASHAAETNPAKIMYPHLYKS